MNDRLVPDSWWLLSRARGVAAVMRLLVLTAPLVAVGLTWVAARQVVPPVGLLVLALAGVCVVLPDSHTGLLVVVVVAIEWILLVEDRASPWVIGVALAIAVFHASMAAAAATPPAAAWTRGMRRRWLIRCSALMVAGLPTWAVVEVVHGRDVPSMGLLVVAALAGIALAALWGRDGSLRPGPPGWGRQA